MVQHIFLGNSEWSYQIFSAHASDHRWRCERLDDRISLRYDTEADAHRAALRAILATVLASVHPASQIACWNSTTMYNDPDGTTELASTIHSRLGGSSDTAPVSVPLLSSDMTAEEFSRAVYRQVLVRQHEEDRAHPLEK